MASTVEISELCQDGPWRDAYALSGQTVAEILTHISCALSFGAFLVLSLGHYGRSKEEAASLRKVARFWEGFTVGC